MQAQRAIRARDPERRLENRNLRKFRAFAQGYIAFIGNRWSTLEMGRPTQMAMEAAKRKSSIASLQGLGDSNSSDPAMSKRIMPVGDPAAGMTPVVPADKPFWVIMPTSLLQRFWELFLIIPILYTASVTPYRVFFEESKNVRTVLLLSLSQLRPPIMHVVLAFTADNTP